MVVRQGDQGAILSIGVGKLQDNDEQFTQATIGEAGSSAVGSSERKRYGSTMTILLPPARPPSASPPFPRPPSPLYLENRELHFPPSSPTIFGNASLFLGPSILPKASLAPLEFLDT